MIPSMATTDDIFELTHDLEGVRRDLEARFTDLGQFEGFLLTEQTSWDDQSNPVVRVIALYRVKAHVTLTSEAVDGLVRAQLQDGSRVNWRFFYLKEGGFSVSPFEDFWIEPVGDKHA